MSNTEKNSCGHLGRWTVLTIAIVLALGVLGWATMEQQKSIMRTVSGMKECGTFVDCVEKAGLSGVLEKDGPFSVFIPTNEAFAKLSPSQLKSLLDNKSALTALLLYHMVPKKISSTEMQNLSNCLTCTVPQTSIACTEHTYGQGNCTGQAIPCTNGVIFLIDSVQIPAFLESNQTAAQKGNTAVVEETDITVVEQSAAGNASNAQPEKKESKQPEMKQPEKKQLEKKEPEKKESGKESSGTPEKK